MNIFVFDIETIPDVASGRKLYDLNGLSDADTAEAMFALRREKTGNDFLPHYLQQVVAISIVFKSHDNVKVWSLGDNDADEKEIIQRFFAGLEKYTPTLVSWNGSGFDLPVLHYRAMHHKICAPRYWETGEFDQSFKWNNYLNRFHSRHTDLMDVLAGYSGRANAPLDEIASMLGFPGKMGMSGSKVWDYYQAGEIEAIRNYCETDVLNTYLVYLRFELMRGQLNESQFDDTCQQLRDYISAEKKAHFDEFLAAYK